MLAQWVPSLGEHKSGEQRQFFLRTLFARQSRDSHEVEKAHCFTPFGGILSAKTQETAGMGRLGGVLAERLPELAFGHVCPDMQRLYQACLTLGALPAVIRHFALQTLTLAYCRLLIESIRSMVVNN
jgi:hypothetical protein